MLDVEIKFYTKNEQKFLDKYAGKYLVIHGKNIEGVFESHAEAYAEARKELKLGTFLIQHCVPGQILR